MTDRVRLLDVWIDNVTAAETIEKAEGFIAARRPSQIITLNVDGMVKTRRDEAFRAVVARTPLVLADGMPLLWAARFLGTPLRERVCGSDLVPLVSAHAARRGHRVFFLGGAPGVAERMAENLKKTCPGLRVAGADSPPPGFEAEPDQNARVIARIRQAVPTILFVAMGAPRQEKWLDANLPELRVPLALGVGGVFDMLAGLRPRAPLAVRRAGFEWMWRLAQEPERLWRRYLWDNPVFFRWVLMQKFARPKLKQ